MGTDLAILDNRMIGGMCSHYKKETTITIDTLPTTLETHKLAQILFGTMATQTPEEKFDASLITDHLPATIETEAFSEAFFSSEMIEKNDDGAMMSYSNSFVLKESKEMREKYSSFMESPPSQCQEKCKSEDSKVRQKEFSLPYRSYHEGLEKKSASYLAPTLSETTPPPQVKESSLAKTCESSPKEMEQQKDRMITKMQCKEKEFVKTECDSSERVKKQKETEKENSSFQNIQITKEKTSDVLYQTQKGEKEKEGEGRQGEQQQHEQQKDNLKKKKENKVISLEKSSLNASFYEDYSVNENSVATISSSSFHPNQEIRQGYSLFIRDCGDAMATFRELLRRSRHLASYEDEDVNPLFDELSGLMVHSSEKMQEIFSVPEDQMSEQLITDSALYLTASHLNIMFLFTELLKLIIENEKQERVSRRIERDLQLKYIQEVVDNFTKTAASLQTTGIMSGIMGITAGVLPLFGFTKLGQSAVNYLGHAFDTFKGLKAMEACKRGSQILSSISKMNEETGKIRQTHAEGDRFKKQQFESLRRTDGDENTRRVQEYLQEFRELVQRILEKYRQEYELTGSIYAR